jgi:hypothetical protein
VRVPYVVSVVLFALGLIALIAIGLRVIRSLRRFSVASNLVGDRVGDRVGMIKARSAALGVAFGERRSNKAREGGPRVPLVDRGRQEDYRG